MKKVTQHIMAGWIIIWGITAGAGLALDIYAASAGNTMAAFDEMDRFFAAKEYVFKREWEQARRKLEAYLEDFPEGELRDEAFYWLAQSLNMLSQQTEREDIIVQLKEAAVDKTNQLMHNYPDSVWRDDAAALQVEIAAQLVLSGKNTYKTYIERAVSQEQSSQDIKLAALQSMAELNPDYVLPVYHRLLENDPDQAVRKKIVSLLGRFFPDSGMELMETAAESDKNKDVRKEAEFWLERARMSQIPVRLKFSLFECYLKDESKFTNFPDLTLKTTGFNASDFDLGGAPLPALNRIFEDLVSSGISISKLTMPAAGTLPIYGASWFSGEITMTHMAGDYRVWINPAALEMSENRIEGEVEFRNRETNRKHTAAFKLDKDGIQTMAIRSGDAVTLLILEYMQLGLERPDVVSLEDAILDAQEPGLPDHGKLDISAIFTIEPGLEVHTARKSFSINEFERNLVNFQQGKAVIHSRSSNKDSERQWTLLGDIFWLKRKKSLIGFGAYLIDPERKILAEGLISVPVEDPSSFRLLYGSSREEEQTLLPREERRTRPIYSSITNNVQGWRVFTTLQSAPSLTDSDKWDFSLSQAETTVDETEWILTGRLMLLREEGVFIARQAALINSQGDVFYGDELVVPAKNPAEYRIIKK
ncbi:MAG: HEAT repeat domain-containing protein [Candidatus Aminicenantes bacterium]